MWRVQHALKISMSGRPFEPHWWQIWVSKASSPKNVSPYFSMFGTPVLEVLGPLGALAHKPQEIRNKSSVVWMIFEPYLN